MGGPAGSGNGKGTGGGDPSNGDETSGGGSGYNTGGDAGGSGVIDLKNMIIGIPQYQSSTDGGSAVKAGGDGSVIIKFE
jgi:hypothetical protein